MSYGNQTFRGSAALTPPTIPTIYNETATLAATEYSKNLGSNIKAFMVRARGFTTLQVAYTVGETNTKFITISPGTSYYIDGIDFTGTIYFRSSKASQVIEIVTWS